MSLLEKVAGTVLGLAAESAAPSSNWGSIHPDLIAVLSQEGAAGFVGQGFGQGRQYRAGFRLAKPV